MIQAGGFTRDSDGGMVTNVDMDAAARLFPEVMLHVRVTYRGEEHSVTLHPGSTVANLGAQVGPRRYCSPRHASYELASQLEIQGARVRVHVGAVASMGLANIAHKVKDAI